MSIHRDLGEDPVYTFIDSEKFVRALDNLFMNALKFSIQPGTIDVSLKIENHHLLIQIQNEGRPITEEQENLI